MLLIVELINSTISRFCLQLFFVIIVVEGGIHMNQEKIGKFIAQCRKDQKLTQEQLAEKLNITYKAVSKWKTGKGMPDTSIMMDLCNILEISVNELLSGKKLNSDIEKDVADENLIKLKNEKESAVNSARWGFVSAVIILLIYNIINIFKHGVEKVVVSPEWLILN